MAKVGLRGEEKGEADFGGGRRVGEKGVRFVVGSQGGSKVGCKGSWLKALERSSLCVRKLKKKGIGRENKRCRWRVR